MTESGSGEAQSWAIDAGFVGEPNPDLDTALIGTEALVFDPVGPFRIPLNTTAALIWACLDGKATLAEISTDLADGTGAPFEAVLVDVIAVVVRLVARGIVFVAGVARAPVVPPPTAAPLVEADFPPGDAGLLAVRLGDEVIGVRSNDAALLDIMRNALAPSLGRAPATPRLSLVASPDRGRIPGMYFLYRDDELAFSSASRGRALRATLAHLDGFLPPPPGTVRLNAHVLVGKSGAVLVSGTFREMLDVAGRRLARAGWQSVDGPAAFVDRADFQAVVIHPRLDLDSAHVATLNAELPPERGERARPGRYPVKHLVLVGSEPDPVKVASPAQRVAALLPLLRDLGTPVDPSDVEWLPLLDRHPATQWIYGADDRELLDTLDRLGGRAPPPTIALPR